MKWIKDFLHEKLALIQAAWYYLFSTVWSAAAYKKKNFELLLRVLYEMCWALIGCLNQPISAFAVNKRVRRKAGETWPKYWHYSNWIKVIPWDIFELGLAVRNIIGICQKVIFKLGRIIFEIFLVLLLRSKIRAWILLLEK